jgi:dolichol-phosphate mannosyltransferase
MKFSLVIPAKDEECCIVDTLEKLCHVLERERFDYEVVVVADHCTDQTEERTAEVATLNPRVRPVRNEDRPGFGMAVRTGLNAYSGDAVAVFMADASDSPEDAVRYFREIEGGAECVFGSRFIQGSRVIDYPSHKLFLNRIANWVLRLLFRHGLNDTTNAFKCYRREVVDGCRPLLARHFNLTVELPLKAVLRGYCYKILPISWTNRKTGISKLKIHEMGSRYLFIMMYCLLEKWLTGRDYHREIAGERR